MTTGERIRNRRKDLDMSVEELATLLGKNRATVYRYESDEIENMPITIISPIAEALDTTPEYILGWTNDPYDYDKDSDSIFDTIPTAVLNHLKEAYNDDMQAVWKAYQAMEEDAKNEAGQMYAAAQEEAETVEYSAIRRGVKNLPPIEQKRALELLKVAFGEAFKDDE